MLVDRILSLFTITRLSKVDYDHFIAYIHTFMTC